ncbi:multidrug DMT transporter permease [Chryseobacterium sp. P1-3]|uniref:Multidrug DMT transporter permease n=1 Tax=Chryseobacterium gallinarum TaxID=1324352 RepID=A0A0G3M365_CHRGL|nr:MULTISPECIES: DMT family transporter [Chryseobacterium]AKK72483.1 multidrug DMT transporter permease [Chryseobacterium gallinarum]KFF74027.1 multidrug DMT transporter permease [Chryseobacterium sp. P1-3]MCL8536087.1 DMT family transporter [Chryseobacterium gallinarum]
MNADKEKWVLLIILSIIWGSSFILIKKSLEHFNPFQVGGLRVLIAGIILMPIAISNYKLFPKKHLKWLILAAFTGNFIPMFLFPIAETEVSSSIAGIINSMMPIFVIIVGALVWKFETTRKQIIGTLISFTGVCILAFGGGTNATFKLIPILLLLLATLCYALSTTTVKSKLMEVSSTILSAFVFSFVLLFPSIIALTCTGFFSEFTFSKDNMLGLMFVSLLSIFGTGLAMMMNYRLLKVSTPLFASTVTLVMPIVAIIWGIIDGEKLTYMQFAGAGVIIAGLIFLRTNSSAAKK